MVTIAPVFDTNGVYRFSLLEYQLLAVVPTIVTLTTPTYHAQHAQETQWINLATRTSHRVCPALDAGSASTSRAGKINLAARVVATFILLAH